MTFAIVNLKDGMRRDMTPFLLNNDAFPDLENAYLFRGRIQQRSCYTMLGATGRLNGAIGTTDGAGSLTLPDAPITEGLATFVIAGDTLTDPGGASPVTLLTTGATTGTLNRTTGVLATNALNTAVTYLPGLPVMGLRTLEDPTVVNFEMLMAFDTRFSYLFNAGTNDFDLAVTFANTANTFVWSGTDSDFFWTANYRNAFWATNNIAGLHAAEDAQVAAEKDGIRWYGTVSSSDGWRNFNPIVSGSGGGAIYLLGALIVLPYKDRLVALNTKEAHTLATSISYPQRARWSQNGTPFYGDFPDNGSADAQAWADDVVGKGGWIDAPTEETIVSAQFIKDTLIVYFERSTWQLVYTGNETLPFVWQKINTELGAESTFSQVPFDRGVFGVGNYGLITTDSVNVGRIDQKVPDIVFQIQNKNNGVNRVYGIRDYTSQLVYWTFPLLSQDSGAVTTYDLTYPNQVLVYNYLEGSWSTFDDSFTCFGYFQQASDITWADLERSWESANFSWNSEVLLARYPDVAAGNQRGFVFIFSQKQNLSQNSPSIPISDIDTATNTITAYNHNFVNDDFVYITGAQGVTGLNGNIYKVTEADVNTFVLDVATLTGTYTGEGLITHMPNIFIQTKDFNPFYEAGKSVRLKYFDIYIDRTTNGEFTANFYTSSNYSTPIDSQTITTGPEPTASFSAGQARIWHRVYTTTFGSFFENVFTMSDDQMKDLDIATSRIVIHGLIYYVSDAGRVSYDI